MGKAPQQDGEKRVGSVKHGEENEFINVAVEDNVRI